MNSRVPDDEGTIELPKLATGMRISISADHDPLVCSRVLGLFAQRNLIPSCFSAWIESEDVLRIILRVTHPAGLDWRLLWRRLEAIPSAITVEAEPYEP